MISDQDREYHKRRALAEMDRAYSASSSTAAEVHLRLSTLHMECLKVEDEDCDGSELRNR